MERFKSAALVVLVACSLVQSYYLAYSKPEFDAVTPIQYVETELTGTPLEMKDLVFPDHIAMHFGDGTHTVLPHGHYFYNKILDEFIKKRTFDGLRIANMDALDRDWEEIRNQYPGLEIRFKHGIPLSVLKDVIQVRENFMITNEIVTKIWMFADEKTEEVKTYFFTDFNTVVFEAVNADVRPADIEWNLAFGAAQPRYRSVGGEYYLPNEPIQTVKFRIPYTQFSQEQLTRSLFADPDMTRSLLGRDGSLIVTDGKRGLQLSNDGRSFSYTDPVFSPVGIRVDIRENLQAAVQFTNQHGGWNGKFQYAGFAAVPSSGGQTLSFRQYLGNFPVISLHPDSLGTIKLELQQAAVSRYERSMIVPEIGKAERFEAVLPGGQTLDRMLSRVSGLYNIVDIYPAYEATVYDEYIEFVPRWAIELRDGTVDFL